jgi:hypothetical protein
MLNWIWPKMCSTFTRRIREGQFNLTTLDLKDSATPVAWNAVLSDQ